MGVVIPPAAPRVTYPSLIPQRVQSDGCPFYPFPFFTPSPRSNAANAACYRACSSTNEDTKHDPPQRARLKLCIQSARIQNAWKLAGRRCGRKLWPRRPRRRAAAVKSSASVWIVNCRRGPASKRRTAGAPPAPRSCPAISGLLPARPLLRP